LQTIIVYKDLTEKKQHK